MAAKKTKKPLPGKTPPSNAAAWARYAHGTGAKPGVPTGPGTKLGAPTTYAQPAWTMNQPPVSDPRSPQSQTVVDPRSNPPGVLPPTAVTRSNGAPTSNVPNTKGFNEFGYLENGGGTNPVDLIKALVGHIGTLSQQQVAAGGLQPQAAGPAPGTQLPGGGVQPEGPDATQAPAGDLSGFQDPYAAQKAAFEQSYQQAIPQLEALRAQYAGQIQGYGQDAQAQAGVAQGGIQQALASAQAQNAQGAQGISADLASQGFNPAQFNAQAASQGGLLTNQGTLQDALSKRLAQVQGQQTQSNLTASDLASQGARQNLDLGHVTGQAAYTDKTASAQNDYQTQMAKIAADEAAATAKASSGGGGGSGKNASGLTAYQQAQLDKSASKDTKAAAKVVDDQKSLGALLSSSLGRSPAQIGQALQNGTLSESDLVTHLRDNVGLNPKQIIDALKGMHLANTPSVMQKPKSNLNKSPFSVS